MTESESPTASACGHEDEYYEYRDDEDTDDGATRFFISPTGTKIDIRYDGDYEDNPGTDHYHDYDLYENGHPHGNEEKQHG